MFLTDANWTLDYQDYDPALEKHREALCTIGNGYMGSRGALEEASSGPHHYPGTYLAGLYNRLTSRVGDRDIENEDFVNIPDWTWITFRPAGGDWLDIDRAEVLDFRRQLDLRGGLLHRRLRVRQPDGKISTVESTRFVSMDCRHLAVIRYHVTPENYDGILTIRSGLNGAIKNEGVARYSDLNQLHLVRATETAEGAHLTLGVRTSQSGITIVEQSRHLLRGPDGGTGPVAVRGETAPRRVFADFEIRADRGKRVTLEKTTAIASSRDGDDPYAVTTAVLNAAADLESHMHAHRAKWAALWERLDIQIDGDDEAQLINRLHAAHILATASPFNAGIDAGIPARGLHGEAYRGHVFWDEIFVFPIFNLHFPEISRALLRYRYNRLPAARAYAREHGQRGAMFPWQSGSDGREETQVLHLNPVSGEWGPDFSSLQRHVSLAIAYNTWQYCHTTGDHAFLRAYGAELILSIATCWAGMCQLDPDSGHYEIHGVMGPNEFHESRPGHPDAGLKDNAYTNIMTIWTLERALETVELLGPADAGTLLETLQITSDQLDRWRDITTRMHLDVRDGLISQYDGFLDLKELDWDQIRRTHADIGRMDRILKAEGKTPDDYQLSKQGDLMMLFYVLPLPVVTALLNKLGIDFTPAMLRRNHDYYLARTTHGSTLSLGVHAHVEALLGDLEHSFQRYREALGADVADIQGGTTKEGIHIALMASTITLVMFAYAGLDLSGPEASFTPRLPPAWTRVAFNFTFRAVRYFVELCPGSLTLRTDGTTPAPVTVQVNGQPLTLEPGIPNRVDPDPNGKGSA